jgi:Zn finger protein HypA/HybF involved in hydrogenase expression
MSQTFIKNKEDFICERCGVEVKGNGYTNHCPRCLWSKHVDIYPGDRAAACGAMMKPIGVDMEKGEFVIIHECEKCHHRKRNRVSPEDDLAALL